MDYPIRRAVPEQLDEIFSLVTACKLNLERQQIFQWTEKYPNRDIIQEDIHKGNLFCLCSEEKCLGVINVSAEQEAEYAAIGWQFPEQGSLVIHRLAVHPEFQQQGHARNLMDFAENFAKINKYVSMRLDAFSGNPRVLRFYEERGYVKMGQVFFPGRTAPFYCYEKAL